jgi:hypothetical protein
MGKERMKSEPFPGLDLARAPLLEPAMQLHHQNLRVPHFISGGVLAMRGSSSDSGNAGGVSTSAGAATIAGLSSGSDPTDPIHLELENELQKLIVSENNLDRELVHCYSVLAQGKSLLKGAVGAGAGAGPGVYEANDISHSLSRVDLFGPAFELLSQDSKKLSFQIDECRQLSDRLSAMVRRLDMIQLRAQEALACTEDVLNLKECHLAISSALENGNLALAVSYVRQVHDIDEQAARASDDYGALQQIEAQVRDLVKAQFESAIKNSDLDEVLRLCPHLHVVGLEAAATDMFLEFIETAVFIGISAAAAPVESDNGPGRGGNEATQAAALYAEILSNIFNSAFTICQRYLPVVIQGLERTQGDILFIRRLHSKCEKEVDVVIKKYLSSRNVKGVIASLRSSTTPTSQSKSAPAPPSPAEMHAHLDELALLLQYCGSYSRYLKMLCEGAESRVREGPTPTPLVVFKGPTPFDALQQELINLFYIEGEQWLIRSAVEAFVKGLSRCASSKGSEQMVDIDGAFFVFQRCSQRAIATNNIHAACAILHVLSDHLNTDLLQQFSDSLSAVVAFVGNKMRTIMSRFLKSSAWYSGSEEPSDPSSSTGRSGYIPQGLHNALLFASSLSQETPDATTDSGSGGEGGMWGVEAHLEMLNLLETCIRYTDRLRREIAATGRSIFGDATQAQAPPQHSHISPSASKAASAKPSVLSDEMNKLQLCIEDFDSCKESLNQVSPSLRPFPPSPSLTLLSLSFTDCPTNHLEHLRPVPGPHEGRHLPHPEQERSRGGHPLPLGGRGLRPPAHGADAAQAPRRALRGPHQHLHRQP